LKILVAIPAWDGKICVETVGSLLNEQVVASSLGHELQTVFVPGCGVINQVRNSLVAQFESSDAEKLVFVDADVSWELGAMIKLASHPAEIVGGAYRLKTDVESYPVIWLDRPELWSNEHGLIEVASLPGGFLCISRAALEKFQKAYPDRSYLCEGKYYYAYFHSPYRDHKMFSEDVNFCFEWREAGGQVWLDPEITMGHHDGGKSFTGCIGAWLRHRNPR